MTKCHKNKDSQSFLPVSIFHKLSVAQKIGFGYAIAIGVGVLGTFTGTFTGDYFQHQAMEVERQVDEEVELFNELKSAVLKARIHQQQVSPQNLGVGGY